MAKSTINNEMLAEFAAAYRNKSEMKDCDVIMEYLSSLGKKTVETVSKTPDLLLFMADNGMIKLEDIDKYLVEISWIEYPEVIEKLLRYKRNPPEVQTKAYQEQKESKASDPKNDWMTEKMPDGTLKLISYKGTETEITIPLQIGKLKVSTIGADALSPEKYRLKSDMKLVRQMISKIEIPEGITEIEAGAFRGCTGLKKVVFPQSIKKLPDSLFRGSGIIDVVLPETLEAIGDDAFRGCQRIRTFTMPAHIKSLGSSIFYSSSLVEFNWPQNEGPTEIPVLIFAFCSKLERFVFPPTTVKIGRRVFAYCKKIKEIELPDSVKEIEVGAFSGCQSLIEFHIPKGVLTIKEGTFNGCNKLKKLYVPSSVESIEQGERRRHYDSRPFGECDMLTIYGPQNSCAAWVAARNRIPFVAI